MHRMVLHLAASMAVGLLYSLWSARPLWSDVALLAVLAFAVRLTWRGWAVVPGGLRAPALALAGAHVLAAALSRDPLTAWRSVLGVAAYGLLFLLAAQILAHGVPRAALYRALVLTAQVIVAALAAGWLVDGAPLWGYRFFYERVNSFALVNLLLFPALLVGECRRLVIGEALYVAWFSAARAGAAGLVGGLLSVASWPGSRWALAGIGLAAAVGIAARPDVLADNSRLAMWTVAGRMWADSPLVGQGPGAFKSWWLAAQPAAFATGHAHSLPLNLLAEAGLLGLAAGGWLGWSVLRALYQASRAGSISGSMFGSKWASAALAGTVALLMHSLVDVPTSAPYLTAAWLALVACGLAGDEPA